MRFFLRHAALWSVPLFVTGCLFLVRRALSDEVKEFVVNDQVRHYILYVPDSYSPASKSDLIVVLHGGGGNGSQAEDMTGFSSRAKRDGFLVLYPYGTGRRFEKRFLTWNAGNCCGVAREKNVDDVTFLRRLIQHVKRVYPVRRVYVTGMSNGGMMAYRMACEASDLIDGIAPVSGAMNVTECQPERSLDAIIFHGRADEIVRYEGGTAKNPDSTDRIDRSVAYAEAFWKKQNRCDGRTVEKNGTVEQVSYRCAGAKLAVISIDGEGHTWPGGKRGRLGADRPTDAISATDTILQFWRDG